MGDTEEQAWTIWQWAKRYDLDPAFVALEVVKGRLPVIQIGSRTVRIIRGPALGPPAPEPPAPPEPELLPVHIKGAPPLPPSGADPLPILADLLAAVGLAESSIETALRDQIGRGAKPTEQYEALRQMLIRASRYPRQPVTPTTRAVVLHRDGRICQYCGRKIGLRTRVELDHVLPASLGGPTNAANLVVACARCNGSKAARFGWFDSHCGHPRYEDDGGCRRCPRQRVATHQCHPRAAIGPQGSEPGEFQSGTKPQVRGVTAATMATVDTR